jgi:dolichol-phosphate mannosyltransferase
MHKPDAPVPIVTVVTPVFNEEAGLARYEEAVRQTLLARTDYHFEILLVDDGSTDGSWEYIRGLCAREPRCRGLRLSRNFGTHIALSAGIQHAGGDAVATLACDLQDPPEVVLEFMDAWRRGAAIVWGHRRKRGDARWRIAASNAFSNLIRRFAMPRGSRFATGSFLLMDRKVVECFRQFREHNRITFALVAWTGFSQAVVEYDRRKRVSGRSGWTLRQMFKSAYGTFISFSTLPATLMSCLGLSVFLVTAPLILYTLVCWFMGNPLPGWTSLMLCMAFFFGVQFLLMGLMGEYLHRIYTESVGRPLFFVSETTPAAQGSCRDAA